MYQASISGWYLERQLFLIAGLVTILGLGLGFFVNPWGFLFNGLVGLNLIGFALTGYCPMAIVLSKFGVPAKCASKGK